VLAAVAVDCLITPSANTIQTIPRDSDHGSP
jgi:hypothetical protein